MILHRNFLFVFIGLLMFSCGNELPSKPFTIFGTWKVAKVEIQYRSEIPEESKFYDKHFLSAYSEYNYTFNKDSTFARVKASGTPEGTEEANGIFKVSKDMKIMTWNIKLEAVGELPPVELPLEIRKNNSILIKEPIAQRYIVQELIKIE